MAIWSKLKTELDRAGRAAAQAIDEGKLRLEIFRARQLTDKAAQALGYAVFRAQTDGSALAPETTERLVAAVAEREAEVRRLEEQIRQAGGTPPKRDEEPPASPDAEPSAPPENAQQTSG